MLTIVGIPVEKKCFKIGNLCLFPFGKYVLSSSSRSENFLLNLLWICITGLPLAITNVVIGVSLCCTIVGIPFGKQHFKIARLSLTPFGAMVM
ncbi:YccF domain-containing protein [Eubacteriaceae bacterium ES3]|nr:YccF domain-containing protein [Eubacteriaceae bacterium ES3]